jgi:hypothetical protein
MNQHFTSTDYQRASVKLSRGACFGPCPVYDLTIRGSGEVIYHGQWWVETIGVRRSQISPEASQTLITDLINHDFLNFHDHYDYEDCIITDLATTTITLQIGSIKKTVSRYGHPPTTPRRLLLMEDEIDRVSGATIWVGSPQD